MSNRDRDSAAWWSPEVTEGPQPKELLTGVSQGQSRLSESGDLSAAVSNGWQKVLEETEDQRYGIGRCKPESLQVFNSIRWFVLWTCIFSFFQGFIVNGVLNAVLSSLETRYELPSSRSGLIVSANDFLALVLVLVVSYYGATRNKPRIIGLGVLTLALGSLVCLLPHFLSGVYNYRGTDVQENVCSNQTACWLKVEEKPSHLGRYLYVFMLGNALHGAGSTPMFTLGTTFIDDSAKSKMTSLYLGFVYASASLGVASGYMIGGQFLNIYVDIDKVDVSSVNMTPADPRWVGAWWIPFIISSFALFAVSLPLMAYPKELPETAEIRAHKKSEAFSSGEESSSDANIGKNWRDFPKAMWGLLRNWPFLFLSLGTCMEGMIVSGVAAFGAKFMQQKFNLPAALASFVMGMITVPGAGGGMLLGGYLVKRLRLQCRGIIRLNLVVAVVATAVGGVFLLQCPQQAMAGISVDYITKTPRDLPPVLPDDCNADCGCSESTFEPVCGADGVIYFTPCHAGCGPQAEWKEGPMGPFKMYTNCSCVGRSLLLANFSREASQVEAVTTAALPEANVSVPFAAQGMCMSDCQLLYVVAPIIFVGMLLTFTTVSPSQTATLRCVPENQRSLAIGFQWMFLRLGGTTPGPLMLGAIIDSACWVWGSFCGARGSCWLYQKMDMGLRMFVWWLAIKAAACLLYFLAQYTYRPPHDQEVTLEVDHNREADPDRETVL